MNVNERGGKRVERERKLLPDSDLEAIEQAVHFWSIRYDLYLTSISQVHSVFPVYYLLNYISYF